MVPLTVPKVAPGAKVMRVAPGRLNAGVGGRVAVEGMGEGGMAVEGTGEGETKVKVAAGIEVLISVASAPIVSNTACSPSFAGVPDGMPPAQAGKTSKERSSTKSHPVFCLANDLFFIQASDLKKTANLTLQYNRRVESIPSFLRRWGLALLLMAVIFGFSSVPAREMPNFGFWDVLVKKGGHALGYGLLALSYLYGLKGTGKGLASRLLFTAWLMAVAYSATDEFHQSFIPGRHPMVTDVLIDSIGAAVMLFLAKRFYKNSVNHES